MLKPWTHSNWGLATAQPSHTRLTSMKNNSCVSWHLSSYLQSNSALNKICLEQSGPMENKTQVKGGGGGGGGATYVFKVRSWWGNDKLRDRAIFYVTYLGNAHNLEWFWFVGYSSKYIILYQIGPVYLLLKAEYKLHCRFENNDMLSAHCIIQAFHIIEITVVVCCQSLYQWSWNMSQESTRDTSYFGSLLSSLNR